MSKRVCLIGRFSMIVAEVTGNQGSRDTKDRSYQGRDAGR